MSLSELPPEKRAAYVERLRRLTPEQRFRMAVETIARGKAFIAAELRARHPDASEREIQRMVAERLCGREIADKAYGRRG